MIVWVRSDHAECAVGTREACDVFVRYAFDSTRGEFDVRASRERSVLCPVLSGLELGSVGRDGVRFTVTKSILGDVIELEGKITNYRAV